MIQSRAKRTDQEAPIVAAPPFLVTLAILMLTAAACAPAQGFESIWYTPGSGESRLDELREHAEGITVIAPQAYWVTAAGALRGGVGDSLLSTAERLGIHVMPLVVNRHFNQDTVRVLLRSPEARRRSIASMVREGTDRGFWGWQFDFENVHISDRDSFTVYFDEAAEAFHRAGMTASVAVVPTNGSPGETNFSRFMQENWRGSFDVGALAEAGDFISLMTYSQHGGAATPGPVSGLPWMREMVDFALSRGVPPSKLSLGIPSYSGYWFSSFSESRGARVVGREISHERATELLADRIPTTVWLDEQGVSYSYWTRSGLFEWLFLEDAASFGQKMEYFEEIPGLRGISVWVLGAEDPAVWRILEDRLKKANAK